MDPMTLLMCLFIFFARICDVTMGTLRTISIVQGRTHQAFLLGFGEAIIWLTVIGMVMEKASSEPVYMFFFALGFAAGNVVGIKVEQMLAFGNSLVRVITGENWMDMAQRLRADGFGFTSYQGEGSLGPVREIHVVCRRRDVKRVLQHVRAADPNAFYHLEQAGNVSHCWRPTMVPATGWRAWAKMK